MEELNNNFLIYFLILLCICLILFYLFYKLNNKVNVTNKKLETLDKFLFGVLLKNVKQEQEPDKSEEDKFEKDKSEEDKFEEDKSEEDKFEEDKYNKEKPSKKSNLQKIIEQDSENSD